jgi:hypothetical protein
MFDFTSNRKTLVPRKSLYCAWIRTHESENTPLVSVWIYPSMTMFESRAKVQESDIEAAQTTIQAALLNRGASWFTYEGRA